TKACCRAAGPDTLVPSSNTPEESIPAPASVVRHWPRASKFSRLKPSGSIRAWQPPHTGSLRCISNISHTESGCDWLLLDSRAGTFGGGGGTGAERIFSRSHLPRIVGEVRV